MAEAGAGGFFRIEGVPFGCLFDLEVRPPSGTTGMAPYVIRDLEMPTSGVRDLGPLALARDCTISVEVVDSDGNPFVGVQVGVYWENRGYRWNPATGPLQPPSRPSFRALTDTAGRATFALPRGQWDVVINHPGHPVTTISREGREAQPDPVTHVVLPRSRTLRGTVRDTEGRPVPGAVVFSAQSLRISWTSPRTATDGEGRFVLDGLREGVVHLNVATGTDRFEEAGSVLFPAVQELDLVVGGGHAARGRVVDADTGAAVDGAEVLLCVGSTDERASFATAISAPDGRFEVAGLPSDRWIRSMSAYREGFGYLRDPLPPSGAEAVVRMRRPGSATIRGRVLGPGNAPVAAASVSCEQVEPSSDAFSSSTRTLSWTRTLDDGSFRLAAQAGACSLRVEAPGLYQVNRADRRPMSRAAGASSPNVDVVTVSSGEEAYRDVKMVPRGSVAGEVVDPEGAPVAAILVEGMGRRARTDELGRFLLEGIEPAFPAEIRAIGRGWYGKSGPFGFSLGEEVRGVRIRLQPAGVVRGVVRDTEGRPVAGAWLELRPGMSRSPFHYAWASVQKDRRVRSDAEGRFEFEGLDPERVDFLRPADPALGRHRLDSYAIVAWAPGFSPSKPLVPSPEKGTLTALVDVTLALERVVTGVVSDQGGGALSGVHVRARSLPSDPKSLWFGSDPIAAVTDLQGGFEIRGLPEGPLELMLVHAGHLTKVLSATPGSRVEAVLAPASDR